MELSPPITTPRDKRVFVFGSNRAGRHGAGAAYFARINHGAIYGQGEGRQGSSYAIPTKDARLRTLPLSEIAVHVETFKRYAAGHPHEHFLVTAIGTGLAGYSNDEIAPMFRGAPANCELPARWVEILNDAVPA